MRRRSMAWDPQVRKALKNKKPAPEWEERLRAIAEGLPSETEWFILDASAIATALGIREAFSG